MAPLTSILAAALLLVAGVTVDAVHAMDERAELMVAAHKLREYSSAQGTESAAQKEKNLASARRQLVERFNTYQKKPSPSATNSMRARKLSPLASHSMRATGARKPSLLATISEGTTGPPKPKNPPHSSRVDRLPLAVPQPQENWFDEDSAQEWFHRGTQDKWYHDDSASTDTDSPRPMPVAPSWTLVSV